MRILVTAGNTRERIDEVRDWGNIFTGNTGFAIARELSSIAPVDPLTSNRQHIEESKNLENLRASGFTSHAELRGALAALMTREKYDAVFMTAAVADYAPRRVYAVLDRRTEGDHETWTVKDVHSGKVKSTHQQIAILGEQTEKLVDLFRTEWKHAGLLVKFKLEVGISKDELIRIGQTSRKASGADYLVANTLDMVAGGDAGAFLLSDSGEAWDARAALPSRLKRRIQ
jgi:phosphopantothenoylcysteine synthetase/decarboxylase